MPEKFLSEFDNVTTFNPTDEFIIAQGENVKNTTWASIYSAIVDTICPPGKFGIFASSQNNYPYSDSFGGWLDCDGSWVSQTTYNKLYNVILHTYSDSAYVHASDKITVTCKFPHQLAIGDSITLNFSGTLGNNVLLSVATVTSEFVFTLNKTGASNNGTVQFYKAGTFKLPDLRGEFLRFWSKNRVNVDGSRVLGSYQDGQTGEIKVPIRTSTYTAGIIHRDYASKTALTASVSPKSTASDSFNNIAQTAVTTVDREIALLSGTEHRVRNVALRVCIKY